MANSPENDSKTSAEASIRALDAKAAIIIRDHAIGAGVAGMLPFMLIDLIGSTLIQCRMIKGLCELYGHQFSNHLAKSWIASITGGYTSVLTGSRLLAGWFKFIPGVSLGTGVSAAVVTYALGLLFRRHFSNGGTPATFNSKKIKTQYQQDIKTGEQQLRQASDTPPAKTVKQDLTFVEGIGPKVRALLAQNGINDFKQLADTPLSRLADILVQGGARFNLCHPDTWLEQAKLASAGEWEALDSLKKQLKGGHYTA